MSKKIAQESRQERRIRRFAADYEAAVARYEAAKRSSRSGAEGRLALGLLAQEVSDCAANYEDALAGTL